MSYNNKKAVWLINGRRPNCLCVTLYPAVLEAMTLVRDLWEVGSAIK